MADTSKLQNAMLNRCRADKTPVTVFLTNGFQMKGRVVSFDSYSILLECDRKQNLIYKHAISTVQPEAPVTLPPMDETGGTG